MNFNISVFSRIIILLTMAIITSCSIGDQYGKVSSNAKLNNPYILGPDFEDFLPWPPPKPTNSLMFNLQSLVDNKKCRTLGDLDRFIVNKLPARYSNLGYYKTPNGFAIVLPYDQVTEYGKPISE